MACVKSEDMTREMTLNDEECLVPCFGSVQTLAWTAPSGRPVCMTNARHLCNKPIPV